MQKPIYLICLMLVNFGLLLGQSRKVYFYSQDSIFYNHTSARHLVIDSFPTYGAWVNLIWQNDTLNKFIPAGATHVKYQVSKGNRGEPGVWFRPSNEMATQNFTSVRYVAGEAPEIRARILPHLQLNEDTLSLMATKADIVSEDEHVLPAQEEFTNKDSTKEMALEKHEQITLQEVLDEQDEVEEPSTVWEKAEKASFEFDRMRILRDYLISSNCDPEEVGKSLQILKYDPSRLELLRALSEHCPQKIKPHLAQWADTFFVYPQFRSQVIQLL